MSVRVFISYRRQDCPEFATEITDQFVARYKRNNIFIDNDSIPLATKWEECLERNIAHCDIFVLLIGPQWLELLAERERNGETDAVVYEIEQALRHEKMIAPICIEGAILPQPGDLPERIRGILDYPGFSLRSGDDFHKRCNDILETIEREVDALPMSRHPLTPAHNIAPTLLVRFNDEFRAEHFHADNFVSFLAQKLALTLPEILIEKITSSSLAVYVQLPQPAAVAFVDLFESSPQTLVEYPIVDVLPTAFVDYRYELLTKLGGGGMGTVYKAYDWVNLETVALKKVKPQVGATTRFDRDIFLTLSHEFKILSRMRHPYIIGVLDYGFIAQDEPYFTMEYLNAAATIVEYAKHVAFISKLRLLVQTLEALRYMHWHQFLHRDLKPPNILVTSHNIKVLDFGISIMKQYKLKAPPAGTILYMSPEALETLGDKDPNELTYASDLWSIGIIACEIFSGQHPYDTGSTGNTLISILTESVDWDALDIDESLTLILQRLLEKDHTLRYQDAETVIKLLNEAAPKPLEVGSQDESYLQTAPFTGRATELAVLRGDLDAALNNLGGVRFLAGESGVGKSRLLDELRIEALVDGVMVLRGQAMVEAASPYQMWRMIVRRLCLMVHLTDLQAGILKSIVPDIEDLIGCYLPTVPDLPEPNAARTRLFDTIDFVLRHCPRPLLILLEDLHWADEDSMTLLQHIYGGLSNRQLLIIGTFRTLQASHLQEQFPKVPLLSLQPLQDDAVEELVQKILDNDEIDTDVLSLVKEQAKGNAFSLVEIIRALAEHSDGISKIGTKPIPDSLFKRGIVTVIESRLRRLQPADRMLLQLAAVAGQELDLALLRLLQPQNLEQWLRTCAVNNILEIDEGLWRFAHNQVREVLLDSLSSQESQDLHRRIAQSKVQLYGTNPGSYAGIAMHWEAAGDLAQAGEWYYQAAQTAEAAYSTAQAIEFYRKSLIYLNHEDVRRLTIGETLSKLLRWQTRFDDAWAILETTRQMIGAKDFKLALVRILNGMSDVRQDEGKFDEALPLTEEAEKTAREAGTAGQKLLLEALNNKAWINIRLGNLDRAAEVAQEGIKLARQGKLTLQRANFLNRLGEICAYQGDLKTSRKRIRQAWVIGQRLKDERLISVTLTNLGEVCRLSGQPNEAVDYLLQALALHERMGGYDGKLIALTNLGGCYNEIQQYARAEEHTGRALDILNGRDWFGLIETYPNHIKALYEQGKYEAALKFAHDWQASASRREMEMVKAFAQSWQERATERGNKREIELVNDWIAHL